MTLKKIQLILRDAGVASRRKAEELITEGRVTLNGQVVPDLITQADPDKEHIKVDGKLIRFTRAEKMYFLFNKPRNMVSTMNDPEGRPCIGDVVTKLKLTLFPVGRLDFDAEGLMILTNDGRLAQKLSHPTNQIPRTYLVKVRGTPDDAALKMIRSGMPIGDGDKVGEVRWWLIKGQKTTTWLKVTLFEGKKNELKRIFYRIDHPVRKIRRISFGPFTLGKLPSGQLRELTSSEAGKLKGLLKESASGSTRKKSSGRENKNRSGER